MGGEGGGRGQAKTTTHYTSIPVHKLMAVVVMRVRWRVRIAGLFCFVFLSVCWLRGPT